MKTQEVIAVTVILTAQPILGVTDLTAAEQAEYLSCTQLTDAQFIRYGGDVFWLGNLPTAPESDGCHLWYRPLGYSEYTDLVVHLNSDGRTVTLGRLNGYRPT